MNNDLALITWLFLIACVCVYAAGRVLTVGGKK